MELTAQQDEIHERRFKQREGERIHLQTYQIINILFWFRDVELHLILNEKLKPHVVLREIQLVSLERETERDERRQNISCINRTAKPCFWARWTDTTCLTDPNADIRQNAACFWCSSAAWDEQMNAVRSRVRIRRDASLQKWPSNVHCGLKWPSEFKNGH